MTSATCRRTLALGCVAFILNPVVARADAPAFDRPGIAFAPSTLSDGQFAIEQGLPDASRDNENGVRSDTYTADTTLRYGLDAGFEVQVVTAAWNRLVVHGEGMSSSTEGAGDARVALKWSPKLADDATSLAVLGALTLDTGAAAFTNGRTVYSLGATLGRKVGADCAFAMYANVDHAGDADTWTLSPNFSFPIAGDLSGYVEAGRIFGGGQSTSLAGGGLTWILHDRVQLDLYALRGLTQQSPDWEAGFGVSAVWP